MGEDSSLVRIGVGCIVVATAGYVLLRYLQSQQSSAAAAVTSQVQTTSKNAAAAAATARLVARL